METMSFRFGFDNYIYCNKSVFRKNNKFNELVSTEKYHSKKNENGEKNR